MFKRLFESLTSLTGSRRTDARYEAWGTDAEPPQRTNVMEKSIRVDEMFTVWHESKEMIYRITQVIEL